MNFCFLAGCLGVFTVGLAEVLEECGQASSNLPKYCRKEFKGIYTNRRGEYNLAVEASPDLGQCKWGDFRVLSKIGHGGYGHVALVVHEPSGRKYAAKTFSAPKTTRYPMIRNEECHHAMLDHPLIVRFHCSMHAGKAVVLLMDYVDGENLHSVLTKHNGYTNRLKVSLGQLDLRRAFAQIVVAIEYAHSQGVVFGDLTSKNIMVTRDGNLRLIDLGFSKLIGAHRDEPPTFPNGPRQPKFSENPYIDWYAVGYILIEMVYGAEVQARGWKSRQIKSAIDRNLLAAMDCSGLVDSATFDLARQFFRKDWRNAWGMTVGSRRAIREHPWFAGFDWDTAIQ